MRSQRRIRSAHHVFVMLAGQHRAPGDAHLGQVPHPAAYSPAAVPPTLLITCTGWYDGPSSPLRLYLKRLHLQRDRLRHFQAQQQQGTAAQRSVRGGGSSGSREGSAGSSSSSDSSGGGVTRRRPPVRGPLAPEVHMEAWMQLSTAIGRLARRAAKLAVRALGRRKGLADGG